MLPGILVEEGAMSRQQIPRTHPGLQVVLAERLIGTLFRDVDVNELTGWF